MSAIHRHVSALMTVCRRFQSMRLSRMARSSNNYTSTKDIASGIWSNTALISARLLPTCRQMFHRCHWCAPNETYSIFGRMPTCNSSSSTSWAEFNYLGGSSGWRVSRALSNIILDYSETPANMELWHTGYEMTLVKGVLLSHCLFVFFHGLP